MSLTSFKDLNRKEFALFSILIFALFMMGIASSLFIDVMMFDSATILEHAKAGRVA